VRFTAEARREPNTQLVLVSGMAPSSQSSGTLDGMTGNFFSGPDAEEAIVQGDMAKRLLGSWESAYGPGGTGNHAAVCAAATLPPPSEQAASDAPNQAVGPDEERWDFR